MIFTQENFRLVWPTVLTNRRSQCFLIGAAINIGWNLAFPNLLSPLGWFVAGMCLSGAWYESLLSNLPTAAQINEATRQAKEVHAMLCQIIDITQRHGGMISGTIEIERVDPPTRH